jgi:DeoR/GlpR family transcriptional regulator of sugar metabolism
VSNNDQPLFVEERRRIILEQLRQQGRVLVKHLSDDLQVSAVTIRQDLRALEEDGLLERTYGGAVQRASGMLYSPELSFDVRQNRFTRAKAAIGAAAAALVRDGEAIALDSSTTAYALVPHLKKRERLTIVTNSLIMAQSFLDSPHIQVLMPGGRLRRDSISLVGKPDFLPEINLNMGFFGTRGITLASGITESDSDEGAMKAAMVAHCVRAIIIADGSKWGQVAPYTFARPQDLHLIITSDDAPALPVQEWHEAGTRVEIVRV